MLFKMAASGLATILTVAVVLTTLVPMGATKTVKRDLSQEKHRSNIDIHVSLNDEEPKTLVDEEFVSYKMGDKVTITCVTEGYPDELLNLSWWEGTRPLRYIRQYAEYARTCATSLEDLTVEDSGRTFSCRADDSTATRTVTLRLDLSTAGNSEDVTELRVVVNHDVVVSGDGLLLYGPGEDLSLVCLAQGPYTERVSWWEGDEELEASRATQTKHASSSTLILRDLATADSGRRLSCRMDDTTYQRSVELLHNSADHGVSTAEKKGQRATVHTFGNITITTRTMKVSTIIATWIGIFVFILCSLILAKLCKKRTAAPASAAPSAQGKKKQQKRMPGEECKYSRVDPAVVPQGMKNRECVFDRRFSTSAVPMPFVGDAVQTHGGKKASDKAYINQGFVSHV